MPQPAGCPLDAVLVSKISASRKPNWLFCPFLPESRQDSQQIPAQDRAGGGIYLDAGLLPALVPIPSVRSSIVSGASVARCMQCVPLMPSNAWHDQGADSISQL